MGMLHHGVYGMASHCVCYRYFLGCTLKDSHRVLIMALLQFDYLYYEIGPVVDASLNWMDSPTFDYLELKKIGLVQSHNYTCVD